MAPDPGVGELTLELPRFARFEVVRRLGEGGMGVVFEALDRDRGVRVALKTLRSFHAETLLRLKDEFRALQDIRHPNLVSLGELMRDGDTWFFTMELVDGVDLLRHVRGDAARARAEEITRARPTSEDTLATEASGAQTRGAARFDEVRLRAALLQLAQGVHAVHLAGKVHRDIKPSNVLVARDGRVVLLDFGVVLDASTPEPEAAFVGTIPYMAPEQAATEDVGPPADWYSFGVVLYQCLTGRRPFEGTQVHVLQQKVTEDARPPRHLADGIPEDLDALAIDLLQRDPERRPRGPEILRRLTACTVSSRPPRGPIPPPARGPFLGRDGEIATLRAAYDQMCGGDAVTIVLEGESGVGKSALVRHFVSRLADEERVLVLAGRCYEREVVPYKALDGVMDALGRQLAMLDAAAVAPLLPGTAWLLAQVFPVLRKVAAIDDAALQRRAKNDIQESRARLFATVRELFTKLGERYELVVAIDDLHWADPDGLALLAELLRPPLPPRLLLLATTRPVSKPGGAPFGIPGDVRVVALGRLPGEQALELARLFLGAYGEADAKVAAAIAAEAQGHPLFIDELVRHARELGGQVAVGAHLDDALAARVARLAAPERALLEVLAVAGVSLAEQTAMRAAGLDFAAFSKHAATLRAAHLARADASRGADAIEPYHDRVREAVVSRLGPDARRACHARLAEALEAQRDHDPDTVATHFLEAGLPSHAIAHARKAADKAFEALAYDRAALLYRRALDLAPDDAERQQPMRIRLAEALANAGRGGEAAPAFLDAATRADREQALDLRRRAAEELLIAGQIDPGIAALREVLADVGLRMPSSLVATVTALLFYRLLLWVRGMRYELRPEANIPRPALIRMDACWGVARTLSVTDPTLGSYFQTRMLLYALRHAEAYRLVYALALEAGYLAVAGDRNRSRVERMLEQATTIARGVEAPQARAVAMGAQGFAAFVLGRFPESVELSDRAVDFVGEHSPGLFWDRRAGQLHAAWALAWMGEVKELAARLDRAVREALDRGDLAASTAYRIGTLNLAWLRTGDAAHARAIVDEATRSWTVRARHNQHYWAFYAHAQIDLYEGKGREAYERCRIEIPRSQRALTFHVEILHMQALHTRARAAILLATQVPGSERPALLRVAARDARKLASTVAPYTKPLAELTRAGIAGVRGDDAEAAAALERAATGFDGAAMRLFAAATRRALGRLRGGDEGRAMVDAADAWMRTQEIEEPERMAEMIAPGLRK
jgi:eukaryotic-like serine/threonine-protein kinase